MKGSWWVFPKAGLRTISISPAHFIPEHKRVALCGGQSISTFFKVEISPESAEAKEKRVVKCKKCDKKHSGNP